MGGRKIIDHYSLIMRKYSLLFFLLAFVAFDSSAQRKWKTIKPIEDTSGIRELWIEHWECTGCGDAEVIDTSWYSLPDSLKEIYSLTKSSIAFTGEKTFSEIFRSYKSQRFTYQFAIRGRFTGNSTPVTKGSGAIPIFDVYQYKLISRKNSFADEQ